MPYAKVAFVDADLLPLRCFHHLFTVPAPAAVIESVHPTSQYAYVRHMHGVRHGAPVPSAILEVESSDDVTGGINAGLLVIAPDRARFTDMVARLARPMAEWGPHHRALHDAGIRYGFPEQHFLQVELQHQWIALDPRFNCMRIDVPHAFGVHRTIGRKPLAESRQSREEPQPGAVVDRVGDAAAPCARPLRGARGAGCRGRRPPLSAHAHAPHGGAPR